MGSFSDFLENKVIDHILKTGAYSPPSTVYLGLSTADPTDSGSGLAEPVGNAYIRKAISFGAAAARTITQDAQIDFDTATGDWGTITHWALFDAASNGNILAYGSLSAGVAVNTGKAPYITSGEISISFNAGKISNYLANAILNWVFNAGTLTQPTSLHVALIETTEITDSDTGSTIDELDMTGYAREQCNAWDAASGGTSANTNLIDFGALTGTGETVTAIALLDASTAGNLLFYDNTPNQAIANNDTVQIAAGGYTISVD